MKLNIHIDTSLSKYADTTAAGLAMSQYANEGYYIHFGQTPKLGVSTTHAHVDPHGTYFYKLDWLLENASYGQYALAFKYYTIVKIRKTNFGLVLQDFSTKSMEDLCSKTNLLPAYTNWLQNRGDLENKRYKIQNTLLDFYRYLKEHKIKGNLLQGVDYIEDCGGGYFNSKEPEQIVVRNPKLVSIVDFGETRSRVSDQIKYYYDALTVKLGKPFKTEVKKLKGQTTQMTISFKPNLAFKPIVFNIYPDYNAGVQDGWSVEAMYTRWFISGYEKGPALTWESRKCLLEKEDSPTKLVVWAAAQFEEYENSTNLAENDFTEYRATALREDLARMGNLNATSLISSYKIQNLFLINYLTELTDSSMDQVTDKDIIRELPIFDPTSFDVIADEYQFGFNVSRSTIRSYKEVRSKLSPQRFDKFISDTKVKMLVELTQDQIDDLFSQLEKP